MVIGRGHFYKCHVTFLVISSIQFLNHMRNVQFAFHCAWSAAFLRSTSGTEFIWSVSEPSKLTKPQNGEIPSLRPHIPTRYRQHSPASYRQDPLCSPTSYSPVLEETEIDEVCSLRVPLCYINGPPLSAPLLKKGGTVAGTDCFAYLKSLCTFGPILELQMYPLLRRFWWRRRKQVRTCQGDQGTSRNTSKMTGLLPTQVTCQSHTTHPLIVRSRDHSTFYMIAQPTLSRTARTHL